MNGFTTMRTEPKRNVDASFMAARAVIAGFSNVVIPGSTPWDLHLTGSAAGKAFVHHFLGFLSAGSEQRHERLVNYVQLLEPLDDLD